MKQLNKEQTKEETCITLFKQQKLIRQGLTKDFTIGFVYALVQLKEGEATKKGVTMYKGGQTDKL